MTTRGVQTYDTNNVSVISEFLENGTTGSEVASGNDGLIGQPHVIIRLVISSLATIANLLSLFAIANIKCTFSTHLRLTISLCLSDLFLSMGVIVISILNSKLYGDEVFGILLCFNQTFQFIFYFTLIMTLLNLMGMALDHCLAIVRPLHYPIMMTRRKTITGIVLMWIFAVLLAFSDWIAIIPTMYATSNNGVNETSSGPVTLTQICQSSLSDKYMPQFVILPMILLTFVIMVLIYTRILIEIHKHHKRATNNPDLQKNRKALITTLCILGSFCICWMPYILFDFIMIIRQSLRTINHSEVPMLTLFNEYLNNLVFLNALMDPIIYAIRMAEVQRSYLRILNRILGKGPLSRNDTRTAVSMLDMSKSTTTVRDSTRYSVCNQNSTPVKNSAESYL